MKNLLLRSIRIGWNGWARDKVFIASKEPLALEVLVKEITGEADPIFALSVGNQRAMRKLTVQAMRPDGGILGYMKLPLTEAATERVRHEAQTLERLWALPYLRPHIPRVLYSGMCNGTYVLFQTSVVGKRGPASMGEIHENFLQNLGNVHRLEKPGERLIEEVAAHWAKSSSQAETAWQELGREVLRRCMQDLSGVMVPCGVMHGDFAPWNTRVHLGRLFIFDWESAVWEAPLSWDMFHFEVQTTCFLNRGKRNTFISQSTPAHQASYLLYVLRSAAQLIAEEADRTGINYRRALLAKLLSEQAVAKNVSSGVRRPFDSIRAVQD